jgi:ubiquinone/menaquinone biosynthesis C-methylase UbiE
MIHSFDEKKMNCIDLFSGHLNLEAVDYHLKAWDKDYNRQGRLWGGSLQRQHTLSPGSTVLELGCGDGKTLASMPTNLRITALDVSHEALRLCHRFAKQAELIQADARCLPFRDGSFESIFAFHVTGHMLFYEREALACEVSRVLAHGGRLFFREFGTEDMRYGNGEEKENGTFQRGSGIITHYFIESEVKSLFGDLEITSISKHQWKMRIKGKYMIRSEIEAIFLKDSIKL